jgi:hypothetical protein
MLELGCKTAGLPFMSRSAKRSSLARRFSIQCTRGFTLQPWITLLHQFFIGSRKPWLESSEKMPSASASGLPP